MQIDKVGHELISAVKRAFPKAQDVEIIVTTTKEEYDNNQEDMRELMERCGVIPVIGTEPPNINEMKFNKLSLPIGGTITVKIAENESN